MTSSLPSRQAFDVGYEAHVAEVRRAASTLSACLGFSPEACEEIGLAVTELATNLLKHAQGGTLTLTPLSREGRVGLEIQSNDSGKGIANIDEALGDGFSTTGSRGTGLGTVNRLMDELEINSRRGNGTHIVCRKWLREERIPLRECPLQIGVASRPKHLGQANGDAFVVKHWAESVLVGVIDGLGHGQFAHTAAQAARQYVEDHFDRPLEEIFQGTGRACKATRGVVMALARFDWGRRGLCFASVGNIEARVLPSSGKIHFRTRRGVIGLNAPKPLVTEHPWPGDHLFILHSDGLDTHWSQKGIPSVLPDEPAPVLAQELLQKLAKAYDDATVIVVKEATP